MNPSPRRQPDAQPSIAEIAALTRRLRELSTPGRHVDDTERAAFLAEKEALLARIIDPYRVAGVDETGRELHTHQPQLNRGTAARFDQGTTVDEAVWQVEPDDDSRSWHPGGSARLDLPHPDVLPPVDRPPQECVVVAEPDELAARVAALHQQLATGEHTDAYPDVQDMGDGDVTDDGGWAR